MITGDIEHKELPDELLHEPKGASTASEGFIYVADGAGSGAFKKLPMTSLDIAVPLVTDTETVTVDETSSLTGASLSQPATGVLTDVQAFVGIPQEITTMINKNASELLRLYNNQKSINDQLTQNISILKTKLNEVISELKGLGLFHE